MENPVSRADHFAERELLRLCANLPVGVADAGRIRALVDETTDWEYLLDWATTHRVLPALYLNLRESCGDKVPSAVLGGLQRMYLLNASHNLVLSGELIRLIDLLAAEGIEAVPFKGPLLAEWVYGTVSLRQFGDLDILVGPTDVSRARQLLIADGYDPEFALPGKSESEYLRSEHAFQLRKEASGFIVELHWRFGSRDQAFPVHPAAVWERLGKQTFQGRELPALSPEDLFLYFCVHGAKHGWDRLEWIACLRAMICKGRNSMDWKRIAQRAAESGATRGLHLGILMAASQGETDVPAGLRDSALADRRAAILAREAQDRLFAETVVSHSRREVERHAFYLRSRERLLDQARIVLFSCLRIPHPLARDWRLFPIPASLSFLYYLLRPVRLLREHGFPRLWAMFRQRTTFQEEKYL